MKSIFISAVLMVLSLTTAAQNNCNIKIAYAFYTLSMPGMQMSDEHGNPIPAKVNINRFIYIECCGKADPEIETVLYNDTAIIATLIAVKSNSVIPGTDIDNNRKHTITKKKSNRLWKLELQPAGDNPMPAKDCGNILIKLKVKGKSSSYQLLKETALATLPAY